ncbi:hypothetical protein NDU88_008873 [Pleurodeles waltl]|uniref:Uncharacterized protein n=1 Tax=Pleurodeles waltl TaxID=8319 RepID=A0AAV7PTC1_PLEWA|nr:hypothetical protein NDU88_008873 [Pleurodeles waltl]
MQAFAACLFEDRAAFAFFCGPEQDVVCKQTSGDVKELAMDMDVLILSLFILDNLMDYLFVPLAKDVILPKEEKASTTGIELFIYNSPGPSFWCLQPNAETTTQPCEQ